MQGICNLQNVRGVVNPGVYVAQKGLLILSTVAAIMTCIPTYRFVASLTFRSISFLSMGAVYVENIHQDKVFERSLKVVKMVVVILGIVAIALAHPVVLIASLATEIVLRIINIIKEIATRGDGWNVTVNISMLIVDALVFTGILMASWELIAVAFTVSTLVILYLVIKSLVDAIENHRPLDLIDAICYGVLIGVGCVVENSIGPKLTFVPKNHHYYIRNESNCSMQVTNANGQTLASLDGGKTIILDRPVETGENRLFFNYEKPVPPYLPKYIDAFTTGNREFIRGPLNIMQCAQMSLHDGTALVTSGTDDPRRYRP